MQAVNRLIAILEAVGESTDPASAAEVAEKVGLSLSTVSRLMVSFAEVGLLHRTERDRRYTLGPRLYALARMANLQVDMESIARPYLERLRDDSGETVSMHVLRGRQRVCILEVPSRHPLRRVVPVGTIEPIAGSATGAVLLSDNEPEQIAVLEKLEPRERAAFSRAIEEAAANGWAIVDEGWIEGLTAVSGAVKVGGRVRAAVSISGPTSRFNNAVAERWVPQLMEAVTAIGQRIGY